MNEYMIFGGYALVIMAMGFVVWASLKRAEKLSDLLMTLATSYSLLNQDLNKLHDALEEQTRDLERESDMYKEFIICTLKNLIDRVEKSDKNTQESLNSLNENMSRICYNFSKKEKS